MASELAGVTLQWEAAENKPVVVGLSAAAVFALFFSEWFIHLPVVDLVGSRAGRHQVLWRHQASCQHLLPTHQLLPCPAP